MEKSFDKKRRKTDYFGEEYIELSIPTVDLSELRANGYLRVEQDQKGRLDKFVFGNISTEADAIDMLMYFNHIFNPFSVDEGDMLYTPVYNSNNFKSVSEPTLPDGTKHSSNVKGEKKLTYAEKVERAAKLGLGAI